MCEDPSSFKTLKVQAHSARLMVQLTSRTMGLSQAYSEEFDRESTIHEDHADLLRRLADALVEAAGVLRYASSDLQHEALLARKASFESRSFSFDPKPTPVDQQLTLLGQQLEHSIERAATSAHYTQLLKSTLENLISNAKEAVSIATSDNWRPNTSVAKFFTDSCRDLGDGVESTQSQWPDLPDLKEFKANNSLSTASEADFPELCFPLPCGGGLHVPTCSNLVFGIIDSGSNTYSGDPSRTKSAQTACTDEESTLININSSGNSGLVGNCPRGEDLRKIGVARGTVQEAALRLQGREAMRAGEGEEPLFEVRTESTQTSKDPDVTSNNTPVMGVTYTDFDVERVRSSQGEISVEIETPQRIPLATTSPGTAAMGPVSNLLRAPVNFSMSQIALLGANHPLEPHPYGF